MPKWDERGWGCIEIYGYKIGQKVMTLIDLKTESGKVLPAGSVITLCRFPVKVTKKIKRETKEDRRDYFFNAYYGDVDTDRIRDMFETIGKIKKNKLRKGEKK